MYVFTRKTKPKPKQKNSVKSETTARALDAFCPPRQAWLLTVFLLFYYTVQLKGCRLSQHNIFHQRCRVELSVNVQCKWAPLVEFRRMGWRYLKRFTLRQIVSYRYFCRRSSGRTLKILNTLIWFWQVNAAIEFLKNSKPQTNYHHWLRHNNLMPHWLSTRKTTTPGRPLYCSWFSWVMKSFVNSLHQLTRMEVFLHTA